MSFTTMTGSLVAVCNEPSPALFDGGSAGSGAPKGKRNGRRLRLPHGYQFLDLREIAHREQNCLAIDKTKLVGWIKGLRKGLDKPAQLNAGRKANISIVLA
jgi:hypothetical protein